MSSNREKLLAQFRELVTDRLAKISRALMTLEQGGDVEAGKLALRELHGLKGEARMMGFSEINTIVHEMEELVRSSDVRQFALAASSVDALLAASDGVAVLAGTVTSEPADVPRLLEWLKQATQVERERNTPNAPKSSPAPAPKPSAPQSAPRPSPARPSASAPSPLPQAAPSSPEARRVEKPVDTSIRITQQSLESLTSLAGGLQQRSRMRQLHSVRFRQLTRDLSALHTLAEDERLSAQELATRIGKIKDVASELNRLTSMVNADEDKDHTNLAEQVQRLRMLPLSEVFEAFPRMVRELSRDLGKDVDLIIEGEDERIDRSVLESVREPLIHLIRNSLDHGIEARDERLRVGKNLKSALRIQALREGERLLLRVTDDGRGLNPAALRQVAVRKGLLDDAQATQLSDAASIELIFLPGFSSKDAVTDVSGRGVGLDVVRTKLLQVGGEVTVSSKIGFGATFELRVPLSLAVAPVLFVQVGDERLCLTASSVSRAVQVEASQIREVAGRPGLHAEGSLLPFASAATLLGLGPERSAAEGDLVLVINGRGLQAAVAVDRVLEERVQAILPLRGMLSRFQHLAGATALADGGLAMVLSAAHLVASATRTESRVRGSTNTRVHQQARRILVVDDSPLTRELLVSLLESVGYVVTQAQDGAEALERLATDLVDCVVTDLEMPNVDGLELTRRLKQHATLSTLPVVIVTTRGSDADRKRGMEAGADGYVAKSDLVRQDLVDVVRRLLA